MRHRIATMSIAAVAVLVVVGCGYFKGDALFFATADSPADAAALIASLP